MTTWANHPQRRRLRIYVLRRDRGVCWLCGRDGATTVDHVVPRSLGGSDDEHNLRAAHASCNYSRGNNPPSAPVPSRQW